MPFYLDLAAVSGRDLEAGGLAATFQEALVSGGNQLHIIRAYDRLQHTVRGSAAGPRSDHGSIWRALIGTQWRYTVQVSCVTTLCVVASWLPQSAERSCDADWRGGG